MPRVTRTQWELLVSDEELQEALKVKSKQFLEDSVPTKDLADYLAKGWTVKKEGKTKTQIQKNKPIGDSFEDRVWVAICKMGFKVMNRTNDFAIVYDEDAGLSKQVDVIAMDDETCLFIECKETAEEGNKKDWHLELTEIDSLFPKLCATIRKQFPEKKLKFKYIFATRNYAVGEQDKKRMESFKIQYFDDNTILYYEKLTSYIGTAARYQLLGSLFRGQKIADMDCRVPAIRGSMGSLTYYTFLIEPERLLKLGYVLHRTNANNDYDDLMPSYQRLIKKDRLNKVREFVNNGGFFPNSIIISIDSGKNGLQFEMVGKEGRGNTDARMGILQLPQNYQAAYIIDGQHRLYGYSDTKYSENDTIPVVAFDNLDKETQLRLFMEINENQKAVPKALRNILEIDMNFESDDSDKRQKALWGAIAKRLGEDPKSPLNGRVVIGEDAETDKCCITIEYIKNALGKTDLFNKYGKKGAIVATGRLDKSDNKSTMETIYPLLIWYFNMIREEYLSEWTKGKQGYLTRNNTMVALIRLFGDIVDIVFDSNPSLSEREEKFKDECGVFVLALCEVLRQLSAEKRDEINSCKGGLAQEKPYRIIQMALHNDYPDFTNNDIEDYYKNFYIDYKQDTETELKVIKNYFVKWLQTLFGDDDLATKHMDDADGRQFSQRISNKIYMNKRNGQDVEVSVWDEITFKDIANIMGFGSQWSAYFKEQFAHWGFKKNRIDVLSDVNTYNSIATKIESGKKITLKEYEMVHELYEAIRKDSNGTNS